MFSLQESEAGGPVLPAMKQGEINGVKVSLPDVARPLDTANHFGVASQGEQFGIMKHPVRWLARDEAINLAAWLRVLADPDGKEFDRVVKEISK